MEFHNKLALIGLVAIAVPIILHLLNRRSAKQLEWGAMHFLLGSLISRRRRLLLEEMMLLAMRCLLFALVALAIAKPVVTNNSPLAWGVVLPALLLGSVALAVGTAFWQQRLWRMRLWAGGVLLLLIAAGTIALEHKLSLSRRIGSESDVAIVIDSSTSMGLKVDGQTNFQRAVNQARDLVAALGNSNSVTIVLAGANPKVVTPRPLSQRDEIEIVLRDLKPLGGSADLRKAVQAAAINLQESQHSSKQIIVFSDQQRDGWNVDDAVRWQETAKDMKAGDAPRQIVAQALPLPETIRNLSISQLTLSRPVVGTDRPVNIEVRVKNTGTEPVAASKVQLLVDNQSIDDRVFSRLEPGQSAVLSFSHRFDKPGAKVIQAKLAADDDLADDNTRLASLRVIDRLPVLIVSGNSKADFLEQASAYIQLALSPQAEESSTSDDPTYRPLIQSTVVEASALSRYPDLSNFRVIILADVSQLLEKDARRLAEYVARGGGLLVAPGARALPEAYKKWRGKDGEGQLLPAQLGERRTLPAEETPVHLALSTFSHPALVPLSDVKKTDFSSALFRSFWKLVPPAGGQVESGGNFTSGDPMLVEKRVGAGTVILLATSLDMGGGNLATRKSFPVLLHSLVYHLAEIGRSGLTFEAGQEPTLSLSAETGQPIAFRYAKPGLEGQYFAAGDFTQKPALTRTDPKIEFDWQAASPAPQLKPEKFSVRWTGALVPQKKETYKLMLTGQGAGQLWLDDKPLINRGGAGTGEADVPLEAGRHYRLKIEETKTAGTAGAKLEWSSPSVPRQVVPDTALSHVVESAKGEGKEDAFVVTSPDGTSQSIPGEVHEGVLSLKMPAAYSPGVYYVRPPESVQGLLVSAEDEKQRVPVALVASARESDLKKVSDDDWQALQNASGMWKAPSFEILRNKVLGNPAGQELWKYMALAALVLLIAEIALTRWIAIQRQVSSDPVEGFEFRTGPGDLTSLQRFVPGAARTAKTISASSLSQKPAQKVATR